MTEEMSKLYENLLRKTRQAFERSQIRAYAQRHDHKWFYEVSATPINRGGIWIVGFNWGAKQNENYPEPNEQPSKNFSELGFSNELGSFSRLLRYLTRYFSVGEIETITQTNFCFFRSAKAEEINALDLQLSAPLFIELIEKTCPSTILAFSRRLQQYLADNKMVVNMSEREVISGNRLIRVSKGDFSTNQRRTPIFFLPHPNYPISKQARDEAWKFCLDDRSSGKPH